MAIKKTKKVDGQNDTWIAGITGCNKVPVEYFVLNSKEKVLNLVTEHGGDPNKDLYQEYLEAEDELEDLFCDIETYVDDLPEIEYMCFKIATSPDHTCWVEEKHGRRLYCVKKEGHTATQIKKWIEATVI